MSDFKIIETQEQFDQAISERIARERAKFEGFMSPEQVEEKYKNHISPETLSADYVKRTDVEEKYKGYSSPSEVEKLNAKIKGYETNSVKMRIGQELGIPLEMIDRLNGEDEEAIKKDAEVIAKILKAERKISPLADNNPSHGDSEIEKYKKLAKSLRKE